MNDRPDPYADRTYFVPCKISVSITIGETAQMRSTTGLDGTKRLNTAYENDRTTSRGIRARLEDREAFVPAACARIDRDSHGRVPDRTKPPQCRNRRDRR
jgi:hypothetical protein